MYKTGDRGTYRADGSILYLARSDQQIELRGFRIALSEIESVLAGHPAVQAAAVIVRENTPGHPRLVAYALPGQTDQIESAELCVWLKQRLPDHMIPSAFVILAAFPLTPNGKLDRRALPAPAEIFSAQELEAPRNEIEAIIAANWRELLGLREIGRRQSFFDLGGHSLIAPQAIAHLNAVFQVEFPLRVLFTAPTIAELAQLVANARAGQALATVDRAAEDTLTEELRRTRSDRRN
jgi:acyl carrier protein